MSPERNEMKDAAQAAILQALGQAARRPLVIGLCGAQGSGKSTLAAALAASLNGADIVTAVLSLDDLYLTRAERERQGADVHPLLRTRGVPGTHDVALGLGIFSALDQGCAALLPRFDKASDDRTAETAWGVAPAGTQVLIFEGWCVGARPEPETALVNPANVLERLEDPNAVWRHFVNAALAGPYQTLFARIDLLIFLAAPDFDSVARWRAEQELELSARSLPGAAGIMSEAALARFIQHYERLTRHILATMPHDAALTIVLDTSRAARCLQRRDCLSPADN